MTGRALGPFAPPVRGRVHSDDGGPPAGGIADRRQRGVVNSLTFDDLRWLNLLWLVPLVVAVGVWELYQRRRALRLLADARVLPRLTPPLAWGRAVLRLGLLGLALVLLVAAAIGPRWGEATQKYVRRGVDLMVLLDVSRSMLARDVTPSRLERARIALRDDLLPVLAGDRIGLIAFAGSASLVCPLTRDYGFFRLALADVSPETIPRGGTLIGDAIRRADEAFDDKSDAHKLILLITDGEDQESYPVEAARALWQERKIPIIAISIGDEREGARVPIVRNGRTEYLKHDGKVVWTRARTEQLRQIAAISPLHGLIRVGTKDFNLGKIYTRQILPMLDVQRREEAARVTRPSRSYLFVWAALVILAVESVLSAARSPAAAGSLA